MGVIYFKSKLSEFSSDPFVRFDVDYLNIYKKFRDFFCKKFLSDFITFIETGKSINKDDYSDGKSNFAHIVVRNISSGELVLENLVYINEEKGNYLKPFSLKKGDILIAISSNVGASCLVEKDYNIQLTLSHYIARIRVDENKINKKLLVYYLNSNLIQKYFRSTETGKTLKNLSKVYIHRLPIALPNNIEQQNEIVNKIIPIEQEIKQLKDSKKDILEIINEVFEQEFNFDWKTSEEYLDKLFHKINFVSIANNELKFDISLKYRESFEIAKKKVKVKLIDIGKIAQIKGGKRLPKGQNVIEEYTGYKYVRVDDLNWDGTFDIDNIKYISKENHLKIKNYIAKKDDILLTIVGATVGKCGIVPEELDNKNITENFARITINNKGKILPKYFEYCLQSNICQFQFDEYTGKASQGKLALFRIKKVQIPYIDINRQIQIIEKIKSKIDAQKEIDKKIEEKQNKINELIENSIML